MDRKTAHTPVLRDEVAELLCPAFPRILVDCTVGLGGHGRALLEAAGPEAQLIGMDVDEGNLSSCKENLKDFGRRVRLFQANFADIREVLAEAEVPGAEVVLADLGPASSQLDDPGRGLSFAADGPLDMRLDERRSSTAAELVNKLGEKDLAELIYRYGEERYSRRIAGAIVAARRRGRIERTTELARLVAGAYPPAARRTRRGVHPATRTFLALRMAVNDELGCLQRLLEALPDVLTVGGRAGIISFHSLEDRPVKQALAAWAATGKARLLNKKPIVPSPQEVRRNPRSRSAKLRGIERVAA